MRDFRHAKAMARTLRVSLAARGFKISASQTLELIAEAFGIADWNTLSATIRADAIRPRNDAPRLSFRPPEAVLRSRPCLNRRSGA
jgi:Glyoxalase superfamily protein